MRTAAAGGGVPPAAGCLRNLRPHIPPMSAPALTFVILAIAALGWQSRAPARPHGRGRPGERHSLHSRPVYFGALTALWCAIPALLLLGPLGAASRARWSPSWWWPTFPPSSGPPREPARPRGERHPEPGGGQLRPGRRLPVIVGRRSVTGTSTASGGSSPPSSHPSSRSSPRPRLAADRAPGSRPQPRGGRDPRLHRRELHGRHSHHRGDRAHPSCSRAFRFFRSVPLFDFLLASSGARRPRSARPGGASGAFA